MEIRWRGSVGTFLPCREGRQAGKKCWLLLQVMVWNESRTLKSNHLLSRTQIGKVTILLEAEYRA
jgi:hypothetical protein